MTWPLLRSMTAVTVVVQGLQPARGYGVLRFR